ncbi:hypothetical protein ACFPOI_00145 [Nonomuraea angiospora]|uniref:Uncharacterized protein n=1 Tax=Nonomuraea angiospora TaxID=46172 RepID=A0ABR9M2L5_9ACTN|nr:hypothetical protein [Nonomuraea angiospora]MBE1586812.1 hypothetical protein [Nonomuraea angiospora]
MSTTAFTTAIAQARDLLRWCSPLRTELWAARLAADLEPDQVEPFLRQLSEDGRTEARLTLAALAAVDPAADARPVSDARPASDVGSGGGDRNEAGSHAPVAASVYVRAADGVVETLPGWVRRMGRVVCEGGWYGKADPYGEQALAALSFRYENGKEPHLLVVAIDQVNGGLAVDAVVEEVKFLDDLGLRAEEPGAVAGRVLDAFELGDRIMGALVADTLPAVRPVALSRARAVPDLVRPAPDDTVSRFRELPELPGAREAFEKLVEFVGDRPLWWSPARVTQFLTSWLPREAILSEAGIAAMPEVVRAWSRFCGAHPAVLAQVEADLPRLPALMADESLASLGKRIAKNRL